MGSSATVRYRLNDKPLETKENRMKTKPEETIEISADSWEALTMEQLEWLAKNGSYGQRLIANRYLHDVRKGESQ